MNFNSSSALSLISSYDSEDSDSEEVSAAPKTTKHSNNFDCGSEVCINRQRLPLPSSLDKLFVNNTDTNKGPLDDPTLHKGRVRSFPHQRGNWSTYVYVPFVPHEEFSDLVVRLQASAASQDIELQQVEEPHISLTRTVVLLHHWIDSFVASIKLTLAHLTRFMVQLGTLAVYCNEEQTRTFLGFQVIAGSQELLDTTLALDQCLAEFRLLPFYKDPSFHMSVLWVVGDARQRLKNILPHLNSLVSGCHASQPHLSIDVAHCLCKTGNKSFLFPLALS